MNDCVQVALTAPKESSGWLQSLGALFLTLFVFALAYWGTRLIAKRPRLIHRTSHLKVVERLNLGRDRQLLIVQVGETYYLAGVTPQQITLGQAVELPSFASVLDPLNQGPGSPEQTPGPAPGGIASELLSRIDHWISKGKDLLHAIVTRKPSGPPDQKDN